MRNTHARLQPYKMYINEHTYNARVRNLNDCEWARHSKSLTFNYHSQLPLSVRSVLCFGFWHCFSVAGGFGRRPFSFKRVSRGLWLICRLGVADDALDEDTFDQLLPTDGQIFRFGDRLRLRGNVIGRQRRRLRRGGDVDPSSR